MPFITDEVKAKRAADINDRKKTLKTLRRNEISRFFEEGIPTLCEEARKAAVDAYLMTGKLPDEICIYDHDRRITSTVANYPGCRKALLKKLQSLEERVCDVEFKCTESKPWEIASDPCIVIYFSNNQE
jgi:hypothetical protein